jgi:hypothetical protein
MNSRRRISHLPRPDRQPIAVEDALERAKSRAAAGILEAVQRRLDEHPEKMRQRRETVEHPFGTIKDRMGATHFLTKTLPRVATEMASHVLGLQSHARHKHHRGPAAHGGNESIVPPLTNRPSSEFPAPRTRFSAATSADVAKRPPGRFHTTKTLTGPLSVSIDTLDSQP